MPELTRRSLLGAGLGAAAAAARPEAVLGAAEAASQPAGDRAHEFHLPRLGKVAPRAAKSIAASGLSVGFETLDRKHFDPKKTHAHLAQLGVKWARCQTGWNRCERKRGRYTFAWLDEVVDDLLAIGVQPWFNLGYGNRLYTPAKPNDYSVGWAPVFSDGAKAAWLAFVRKIAEHFARRVRHWEIWNEPNISGFWKPKKPAPRDYADLVRLTAPEIRKRVPNAVIIGGALAGMPASYLKACLDAGLAEHVDRVSYHPYRPEPEKGYRSQVAAMRKLLAARKKGIRLWQGENGCPSRGGRGSCGALSSLPWTETRQAKWLLRRILADRCLDIELTSYFHLVDLVGYRGQTNFKGLLRGTEYTPKPAYRAYQCLCALFDSATRRQPDLTLSLVGHKIVHTWWGGFVRNGRAMYAYWYPASLLKARTPKTFDMAFAAPPGAAIDQPVLIDPLTSAVYKLEARKAPGTLTIENLPLLEYPLLLTDRAVALPT